jgi:hypothetical protein
MQPAGQDPEARLVPGTVTLPLRSRTNASPFWIMLLLIWRRSEHGIIPAAASAGHLLHLIAGGIVGSMPLSRTQQPTAELFRAANAPQPCGTPTLQSTQQSAAVASTAEKMSSRHVLPRDLSNALKQLDDVELDKLFAATQHELQRRDRLLMDTQVMRPTMHIGAASDQSATSEESPERRQPEEPNVALTQGQLNAVLATFKAGITPSRIARQFGISQSDVRKVLASVSRRSGKGR